MPRRYLKIKKKNAPNEKKLLEIREVGKKPVESPIHLA